MDFAGAADAGRIFDEDINITLGYGVIAACEIGESI
jgi:hypothetical protein